jgi:hypothetical protein
MATLCWYHTNPIILYSPVFPLPSLICKKIGASAIVFMKYKFIRAIMHLSTQELNGHNTKDEKDTHCYGDCIHYRDKSPAFSTGGIQGSTKTYQTLL